MYDIISTIPLWLYGVAALTTAAGAYITVDAKRDEALKKLNHFNDPKKQVQTW